MEYIDKHGKSTFHLLTMLPTDCKCIKRLYGKDLPKDYIYHDVNSNQLIKHNTMSNKKEFPYIVITGDRVNILPHDTKRYDVDKILNRLSEI